MQDCYEGQWNYAYLPVNHKTIATETWFLIHISLWPEEYCRNRLQARKTSIQVASLFLGLFSSACFLCPFSSLMNTMYVIVDCKDFSFFRRQSCLSAFKSMNTIEKTVDQCKIDLNVREARLVFLLYCRHGKYSLWITHAHGVCLLENSMFYLWNFLACS